MQTAPPQVRSRPRRTSVGDTVVLSRRVFHRPRLLGSRHIPSCIGLLSRLSITGGTYWRASGRYARERDEPTDPRRGAGSLVSWACIDLLVDDARSITGKHLPTRSLGRRVRRSWTHLVAHQAPVSLHSSLDGADYRPRRASRDRRKVRVIRFFRYSVAVAQGDSLSRERLFRRDRYRRGSSRFVRHRRRGRLNVTRHSSRSPRGPCVAVSVLQRRSAAHGVPESPAVWFGLIAWAPWVSPDGDSGAADPLARVRPILRPAARRGRAIAPYPARLSAAACLPRRRAVYVRATASGGGTCATTSSFAILRFPPCRSTLVVIMRDRYTTLPTSSPLPDSTV